MSNGGALVECSLETCSALQSLFLFRFNGMGDVQTKLAELLPKCLAGDAQHPGGLALASLRLIQHQG